MPSPEVPEVRRADAHHRFVLDAPTIERILDHIGEPTQPPAVLPARSPPQLAFGFDQMPATADWPEMDQTAGQGGGWE